MISKTDIRVVLTDGRRRRLCYEIILWVDDIMAITFTDWLRHRWFNNKDIVLSQKVFIFNRLSSHFFYLVASNTVCLIFFVIFLKFSKYKWRGKIWACFFVITTIFRCQKRKKLTEKLIPIRNCRYNETVNHSVIAR